MSGDSVRRAATLGNAAWLKRLFAAGANPCEVDANGLTPLHLAALNGHTECVAVCGINDRGVDPSGKRAWALQQQSAGRGWSALHIVADNGKNAPQVVKLLLGLGCDPWLLDAEGRTAADIAHEKLVGSGSAVSELVHRLLTLGPPKEADLLRRRTETKQQHWVQQVRRGNQATIGDFPTPVEDRAPIVPPELKVAEHWHVPFAMSNVQAVRGGYGVQALRNLTEALAEAEINSLRRFELAHARELKAEGTGTFDFRTPEHLKHAETVVSEKEWDESHGRRHIRGDGPAPLHPGYRPFKFASRGVAQTPPQARAQKERTDAFPPHARYAQRPFKSYAYKKWNEIEYGPELFGEDTQDTSGAEAAGATEGGKAGAGSTKALAVPPPPPAAAAPGTS